MTRQQQLIDAVTRSFEAAFSASPALTVQAPGRVNLIGEHTDYNNGFVLPCAIDYQAVAVASKRDDAIIRIQSVDYDNEVHQFSIADDIEFHDGNMWVNYVRGVIKCLLARGYQFAGADISFSGNVPQGAGLSSSAALEVVLGQVFKELYQLDLSQQEIALNGQQAENEFVGCACGIMDQLVSAKGEAGHALLIDCESLATKSVKMPAELNVVIINSNKKRGLVDSEYNKRRQQCEQAASFFGKASLRQLSQDELLAKESELAADVFKCARHVVTENARVLESVEALEQGDLKALSSLMAASHASMRDDFKITTSEIDALVDIVKQTIGERGGVRMTGGGFGGCIVALVPNDLVEPVRAAVAANYQAQTGLKEDFYICSAMAGAGRIG
ncbi:galactokinase [Neiella sp. HB171785]|uniref:Galactokinase n=1 Tax=Neiella litorisoli TaxID=2771431 RepID=A0A8J6QVT9_9GAMM|nr:galactokinase [Neiella litorisoli]MBD1390883.1 galactokinase [Neiella litorisoli]